MKSTDNKDQERDDVRKLVVTKRRQFPQNRSDKASQDYQCVEAPIKQVVLFSIH